MIEPSPCIMKRSPLSLIATCGAGLESLVADEIVAQGGRVAASAAGRVWFSGSLRTAYGLCLWSRCASRVLYVLDRFAAPDGDALYQRASRIDWGQHMQLDTSFCVDCTAHDATIPHSRFASLRVKDAVVDAMRQPDGQRPSVDLRDPDLRLHLLLDHDDAALCIDLSGDALHRRGYRRSGGEAPLRETVAAAVVMLSGWDARGDLPLVDIMCGSGTLLIEAALMATDTAPGLLRRHWGFSRWKLHRPGVWQGLVDDAHERRTPQPDAVPRLCGYDIDPAMARAAARNAAHAGVGHLIHFEPRALGQWRSAPEAAGVVLANPPYGQRLEDRDAVRLLYRRIGRTLRDVFAHWTAGVLTVRRDLVEEYAAEGCVRHRLANGSLSCDLCVFRVPDEPVTLAKPVPDLQPVAVEPEGQAFANRLAKNAKRLARAMRKAQTTCYRLYDADMPEFNFAVDLYGPWLHVQEYAPPATVDVRRAATRRSLALQVLRTLFDLPRNRVVVKQRERQRGTAQYQKQAHRGTLVEVSEQGLRFLVNLTDYLDTGLFLDHRLTRARIRNAVAGKRFLNLFGYTGAATVYAAVGGARQTVTVDASPVYLTWAQRNLYLNGYGGTPHCMVAADCFGWLEACADQFDYIFLDPPTFSRGKRTSRRFAVQDDHAALIDLAMRHLSSDGVLLFSTNFKRFRMDTAIGGRYDLQDITAQTHPPDFARTQAHHCWEVRHR